VPVAVFAALIAPGLAVGGGEWLPRLLGAAAAVVAVLRLRRLWAGLVTGMAVYWLAKVVGAG
jgi:branched-subunit amino acid transport protein